MAAEIRSDGSLDVVRASVWLALSGMVVWSVVFLDPVLQIAFYFGAIGLFVLFFFVDTNQHRDRDISAYLLVPLVLSAVQNPLLGLVAPYTSGAQIQSMTVANIIYACAIAGALAIQKPLLLTENRAFMAVAGVVGLTGYAAIAYLLLDGDVISVLASLRNVITPFVFFLLGLLAAPVTSTRKLFRYIAILAWFTILFGFLERFAFPDVWKWLNIAELWQKKGISNIHVELGVPANFFSSERLGGVHMRRMVSSYADAVNFGTVLALFMLVAWYSGRKWLAIAAAATIVFAISKGGLIGILVFLVVWAYFNRAKAMFPIVTAFAFGIAAVFVYYSLYFSSRSMVLHASGFLAALVELPDHPFGRGLGNIGVLAGLFSRGQGSDITETGLGMIIGQLGVPGVLFYGALLTSILLRLQTIPDVRAKILGVSVFWGITLNIVFNEVALSPNSAAGSFLVLGLLSARRGNSAA